MKKQNTTNTTKNIKNEAVETQQAEQAQVTGASLFQTVASSTAGRSIPGAIELQQFSQTIANEIFASISKSTDAELIASIQPILASGDYANTCELIGKFYDDATIADKTSFLKSCSSTELDRLLESRRSDRSKARKAGLAQNFPRFLADVIAEKAIRLTSGKQYNQSGAGTTAIDVEALAADQVALNKKIRSLQSRISVLRSKLQYAPADHPGHAEIARLQEQVRELQAHRVSTTSHKTVAVTDKRSLAEAVANMSDDERAELLKQLTELAVQPNG